MRPCTKDKNFYPEPSGTNFDLTYATISSREIFSKFLSQWPSGRPRCTTAGTQIDRLEKCILWSRILAHFEGSGF